MSAALYGTTFLIMLGSGLSIVTFPYFTPGHTNAFSLAATTLAHGVAALGCGGLAGLSYARFSAMPSVSKATANAQMSKITSFISNGTFAGGFIPMAALFTSLSMIDDMHFYGVAPAILGMGIVANCIYLQAKRLQLPLWFAAKSFKYITIAIFGFLLLGYCTVKRQITVTERMQVLNNIQESLEAERAKSPDA